MPRGDRTGPDGMGPMTGRGLGYCADYSSPGFTRGVPRGGAGYGRGYGRGYGLGRGRGFGYDRGFYQNPYISNVPYYPYPNPTPYTPENEKQILDNELKIMKDEMKSIEKRLEELKSEK